MSLDSGKPANTRRRKGDLGSPADCLRRAGWTPPIGERRNHRDRNPCHPVRHTPFLHKMDTVAQPGLPLGLRNRGNLYQRPCPMTAGGRSGRPPDCRRMTGSGSGQSAPGRFGHGSGHGSTRRRRSTWPTIPRAFGRDDELRIAKSYTASQPCHASTDVSPSV